MLRPVSGGCWGLRFSGDSQWHGRHDPITVETCFCAAAARILWTRTAYGTGEEPAMRCREDAVCSVACLAWVRGERGAMRPALWPHCPDDILWKPYLQKRLRTGRLSGWKSPRQSAMGRSGITVRTQWQSGTAAWQRRSTESKRELPIR